MYLRIVTWSSMPSIMCRPFPERPSLTPPLRLPQAGLQSEGKRRSKLVRRTHSDLGSDLVRGYSRQMSQPAPITEHPMARQRR